MYTKDAGYAAGIAVSRTISRTLAVTLILILIPILIQTDNTPAQIQRNKDTCL